MSKTLILSDIHFSTSSSTVISAEQLRQLWSGCDELVLNGDTAEAHALQTCEASKKLTTSLINLAECDGVKTTLICGNHDPKISETDFLWFWDKKVLVFHGHAAFSGLAPWSWRAKYIVKTREQYLIDSGDGFDEQLAAIRRASFDAASGAFNSHRPSFLRFLLLALPATLHVLLGWWRFPSLIERWVDKYAPSAKYIIVGHTHHAGIWTRNKRIIVNTGCFGFPSHPRAVIIDNDVITVYRLRLSDGNYSLGRVCSSWKAR